MSKVRRERPQRSDGREATASFTRQAGLYGEESAGSWNHPIPLHSRATPTDERMGLSRHRPIRVELRLLRDKGQRTSA